MQRRQFIGLVGTAALSAARTGYAQTNNGLPLVGVLSPSSRLSHPPASAQKRKNRITSRSLSPAIFFNNLLRLHRLGRSFSEQRLIFAGETSELCDPVQG
jgi:hypothetical protein